MMLKKIRLFIVLLASLPGLISCSDRLKQEDDPQKATFRVSTQLNAEYSMNYPTSGDDVDLGQLPTPRVGDFLIRITQDKQQVAEYQYSPEASNLELSVGKYNMQASYGTAVAAGWNTVFYEGTNDFVLSNSQNTANISLDCGLRTAFAFARFDTKFRTVFSDISVKFITEHTAEPLIFADGETRIACFAPADSLFVLVDVTMISSGKKYTYGIEPLVGLKAADLNVFNFTVQDGQMVFNLTTDNTIDVKTKSVTLDPEWLATRGTKMLTSYDEQTQVSNVYRLPYLSPLDIVVGSNIALRYIVVKFDAQLAQDLGVDSINLLDMTPAQKEIIDTRVGVVVTPTPDGMNYRVNLRDCPSKMEVRNSTDTEYTLTISATNILGLGSKRDLNMKIVPPKFARDAQDESKVWNRYAYIPQAEVTNVPAADRSKFPIEYWISQDGTTWEPLGVLQPSTEGIYINGLKPSQTYMTRAGMGAIYDNANILSFTTKAEIQIPNSNFEQYSSTPYSSNKNPFFELYAPGDQNPWWATNNAATTYNKGTSYTNYAQSYASVHVVDGNDGKSVQISTVGWGKDSKIEGKNNLVGYEYKDSRQFASAGKVFLGSYTYTGNATNPSGTENHGQAIDQKPMAFKFKYKFDNYKSGKWEVNLQLFSGNDEIAHAIYTSNLVQGVFTELEIPIIYNAALLSSTPTQIRLFFTSQNTPPDKNSDLDRIIGPTAPGGLFSWKVLKDSYFIGNTLTIDDIELIYPQDINDKYTVQ